MSKECKISFKTAIEILQNPVFENETEYQGAVKFVSEAFNMSEDAVLEEIEKEFPFSVYIKVLDDDAQETEQIIKRCKTKEDAEDFVEKHGQDFADTADVYAVYIDGKDDNNSSEEKLTSDEQGFIDAVELALDWNIPIPKEDYEKYEKLIKRRAALNKN